MLTWRSTVLERLYKSYKINICSTFQIGKSVELYFAKEIYGKVAVNCSVFKQRKIRLTILFNILCSYTNTIRMVLKDFSRNRPASNYSIEQSV